MKEKVIRALYDEDTITVYQAYNKTIANHAIASQTFVCPPFKKERMTWIKPSFLWMMYRSGWATKENQEYILAIKIKREGFEWALENSCLSHFDNAGNTTFEDWKTKLQISPVRIQWDPERDIFMQALPQQRAIQMGLSGIAVEKYIDEWIVSVEDITAYSQNIRQLIKADKIDQAKDLLPVERHYPLPDGIGSMH
ncbi:DUF4291 domain-containing protein [Chitinophaga ginsengisoli]|uniref:Uncharacterized protein DUF4291 n=1 Tax=Chitinophaga ginsengisoli TaxID=363837 RepID=A0A2P8FUP8_9BACT|nr:DUF4291 domain-containing protein [Chitinophaga ginsengisoli]PSL25450.1 uncharacterized protein DUF4291 [Chitinophaga ginsengisoli]